MMRQVLVLLALILTVVSAFKPPLAMRNRATRVYEDFKLNEDAFVGPKTTDPAIFSEKQLREYTAQYSEDYRMPLPGISQFLELFNKKDDTPPPPPPAEKQGEISAADIQEKTAAYVSGRINQVQFKTVLKAAFGEKYNSVLPRINASLPANKRI